MKIMLSISLIALLLVGLLWAATVEAGKGRPVTDYRRDGANALTLTPPVCPESTGWETWCARWNWPGHYWQCTICETAVIP